MNTRVINHLAIIFCSILFLSVFNEADAQIVKRHLKISDTEGGFTGGLDDDAFGSSVAYLGDLDGDGNTDLAVGADDDRTAGLNAGAIWILFLDANRNVSHQQKVTEGVGGFTGDLDTGDGFGHSVTNIGDLDRDGVTDLAVGALSDDDGGNSRGAIWILFMNRDGTVKHQQKISSTEGNFTGEIDDVDFFGGAATGLGDLDGDGVIDIAVGAENDDDGGIERQFLLDLGAIWVLFMNPDGTVKAHQKISHTEGGFVDGPITLSLSLGAALANMGDLDGDGVVDIAAGAWGEGFEPLRTGAVWIFFLNPDGTVKDQQKISRTDGGFEGRLDIFDFFGFSVANAGDLNDDGTPDLAVGARLDDDGCSATGLEVSICNRGAIWIILLNSDGTVKGHTKISDTFGNFRGTLDDQDQLGWALAGVGDLDGDNYPDIAAGVPVDDDGGTDNGAVWLLHLKRSDIIPNPPETADDMLFELAYKVEDLVETGLINEVTGNLLSKPIDGALVGLQTNLIANARFYTGGFMTQVEKFVGAGLVPPGEGDALIAEAAAILAFIEASITNATRQNPFSHADKLDSEFPGTFDLHQNHPNPFSGSTSIQFTLAESSQVRLTIFDVLGREVERVLDSTRDAGTHTVQVDVSGLPGGTYVYRLETPSNTKSRIMVVL